jgi:hypothetical protein
MERCMSDTTDNAASLPALIGTAAVATLVETPIVPALIVDAGGEQAGWRYAEFFEAHINNEHTRRAYARACGAFFARCETRGLTLAAIRPFDVAAWVKNCRQTIMRRE